MTEEQPSQPKKRRWFPRVRYSLRTLLIFTLLAGSGMGLGFRWKPWAQVLKFQVPDVPCQAGPIFFANHDKSIVVSHGAPSGAFLSLFNATTGAPIAKFDALGLAVSPDRQKLVSFCFPKSGAGLKVLSAADGSELAALNGHKCSWWPLAFSPDGRYVALQEEDQTLKLWDLKSGGEPKTLGNQIDGLRHIAFSPDGKWLAAIISPPNSKNIGIQILPLEEKTPPIILAPKKGEFTHACFSSDGSRLLTVAGPPSEEKGHERLAAIHIWDWREARCLLELKGHGEESAPCASFSHYGFKVAAGGNDGHIRVWDAASGQLLKTSGAFEDIHALQFSSDDSHLVAGTEKGAVVWNLEDGAETLLGDCRPGSGAWLGCVDLAIDSKKLLFLNHDGTTTIWEQRRPDSRYGILLLPEFWLALVFGAGLVWSVWRDRREFAEAE